MAFSDLGLNYMNESDFHKGFLYLLVSFLGYDLSHFPSLNSHLHGHPSNNTFNVGSGNVYNLPTQNAVCQPKI